MHFNSLLQTYLTSLRDIRNQPHATDELSLRPALDALLKGAAAIVGREITFISEGKLLNEGRPDFVMTVETLPIGYIEAEKYNLDLDNLKGHTKQQNGRFIDNLDNFLLTNHLEFRLYSGGVMVMEASLPAPPSKGTVKVPETNADKLQILLESLMRAAPLPINEPRDLALYLSRRARQLRDQVRDNFYLNTPSDELNGVFEAFKKVLLTDLRPFLTDEERGKAKRPQSFDDLFAQTVAYGLFAARCGDNSGKFTRYSAAEYLGNNPFLRRVLVNFLTDLDSTLAWIVDDMVALLAEAPMDTIQRYFLKRNRREDPMIDFYEPFLNAYDSDLREVRGVYYTPVPVVSYIVRSMHYILKARFGLDDGLADKETFILDPAVGTGSFLFSVIDEVRDHVTKQNGNASWASYVDNHLLNRIFGFELLMAPYAIAHLKLGLQLEGQQAPIPAGKRFGVYLTNTLDDAVRQSDLMLGKYISDEANAAVTVKTIDPILVVLGNPPYSGNSANSSRRTSEEIKTLRELERAGAKESRIKTSSDKLRQQLAELTYIGRLIHNYRFVDGQPLGEKNPKWLQDDYVKFIAFAQDRLRRTGKGVVGYVTNHSFLDNATFCGMRQSLMETFTDIYILNLHGNVKKKEKTPEKKVDQNVFEIQQGVSIFIGVKEEGVDKIARIHYADLYGSRDHKYSVLSENSAETTSWQTIDPLSPEYLFVPRNNELLPEYNKGISVKDIFILGSVGIVTGGDASTIAFTLKEAEELAESSGVGVNKI